MCVLDLNSDQENEKTTRYHFTPFSHRIGKDEKTLTPNVDRNVEKSFITAGEVKRVWRTIRQ